MSTSKRRNESRDDDNNGKITVDSSGHLSVGIGGGGLGIDTTNGDLTVAGNSGFSIDTGA
ncbi:hypothetical protein [Nocardia sp. GAS34]|uniref:hypothetical protein n=1 Tax=unclassified Nocardia TaxID=2637762 RepID=UPI003D1B7369